MTNTTLVKTPTTPEIATLPVSLIQSQVQDPEQVLEFAHKAAKALMEVINQKPKQIMIRGERYLSFEDWQTLGRFYGVTVGIDFCKTTANENKVFGYEARAVAYSSGNIISAAEASCFRDEPNWVDKPSFQLKSMAQTRAAAKALRNVLAWVAVLGGFKPTPAEEMIGINKSSRDNKSTSYPYNNQPHGEEQHEYTEIEAQIDAEEQEEQEIKANRISEKQIGFLKNLILEKVEDEAERESQLANLSSMAKWEASELISNLLSQPSMV